MHDPVPSGVSKIQQFKVEKSEMEPMYFEEKIGPYAWTVHSYVATWLPKLVISKFWNPLIEIPKYTPKVDLINLNISL